MTTLTITRGLPASGKTTYAHDWVAAAPPGEIRMRVNRDDLRAMTLPTRSEGVFERPLEEKVSVAQRAQVEALLRAGVSVIVDDTNLRLKYARAWADLAADVGVEFGYVDVLTDPDECVRRDRLRGIRGGRVVGEQVIRDMAARFGGKRHPIEPSAPAEVPAPWTYVPDPTLPRAVLVDIDGTVALIGDRGRYDESMVGVDLPHQVVIDVVRALHAAGWEIVFASGRGSGCYQETMGWLDRYVDLPMYDGLRGYHLFMRPQGDTRKDSIVKIEMLREIIKTWQIDFAIDDRRQVVQAWRAAGLTVLDVADGDF